MNSVERAARVPAQDRGGRARVPAQVRRTSVRGQILDALRAALAAGELRPGEVYSAPVLGADLGVSATPVREAMMQLASEGAVEVLPNRGFRVVERTDRERAELAEVRALLVVPVVLRLAGELSAAHWERLRPLADAADAAPADLDADRAFHRALLALAGNEELVEIADAVHRKARGTLPGHGPAGRARADLLDALAGWDTAAAEESLRDLLAPGRPGAGR